MKLTNGVGVDCVVEVGGNSSLVKSLKCTKRGGIVSSVGYLSGKDPKELTDLLSVLIDRRVILRLVHSFCVALKKKPLIILTEASTLDPSKITMIYALPYLPRR